MRRWPVPALLAGALLAGGCAVACTAGCAARHPPPADPAAMNRAAPVRNAAGARATAQTEFGLLAGGDYGGAWDLWTQEAQGALDRARFVAYGTACRPGLGHATQITSVRRLDDNTYLLDWRAGDGTGSVEMRYVNGAWRVQPGAAQLAGYAAGTCGPGSS